MLNKNKIISFWSSIMRDHADFFMMNLSAKEIELFNQAQYFKQQFMNINNNTSIDIIRDLLIKFINFKRYILRKLLTCDIELSLSPTFVNHMINEAIEFYNDLDKLERNITNNTILNTELHKVWLADTSGHAKAISSFLDPIEKPTIKETDEFATCLDCLFMKADELGKMLERTELTDGALQLLNEQASMKLKQFIEFLDKIRNLTLKCKLLGTLKPIMLDHMIREANYYLDNIQMYSTQ